MFEARDLFDALGLQPSNVPNVKAVLISGTGARYVLPSPLNGEKGWG
jgi:hypothetical protein